VIADPCLVGRIPADAVAGTAAVRMKCVHLVPKPDQARRRSAAVPGLGLPHSGYFRSLRRWVAGFWSTVSAVTSV
jgi:hypothetical protein